MSDRDTDIKKSSFKSYSFPFNSRDSCRVDTRELNVIELTPEKPRRLPSAAIAYSRAEALLDTILDGKESVCLGNNDAFFSLRKTPEDTFVFRFHRATADDGTKIISSSELDRVGRIVRQSHVMPIWKVLEKLEKFAKLTETSRLIEKQ